MANFAPGEWDWQNNTQDVSGIPTDDMTAQLMLKRRLAKAEALRQSQMPQGQMVGNIYVAPHWTQQLAALGNQFLGQKEEENALKEYNKSQSAKQRKLADLLQGKEVTAPVDYNEAGNIPGMEQTTRQPYSQQEFLSKAVGVMPELAPKLIESQVAQYGKEEQPISLSEGGILVNRKGEVLAQNPKATKPQPKYSNVTRDENTGKFYGINDQGQVEEISGAQMTPKPVVPTTRTMRQGMKEITQQWNPTTKQWDKISEGPAFAPQKPEPDPWHLNDRPNIATKNAKGWALHTDKNGNMAYVSPDGKSFEEVK